MAKKPLHQNQKKHVEEDDNMDPTAGSPLTTYTYIISFYLNCQYTRKMRI